MSGGYELDLWEIIVCDYCGAAPGTPCHTRSGRPLLARSHVARLVWFEEGVPA